MKKDDVQIGGTYLAKAGARTVEVRIDSENPKGGWNATGVGSGKPIRVKDAKNLRPAEGPSVDESDGDPGPADDDRVPLTKLARSGKKGGRSKKASKPKAAKQPKQKAPAKPKAMSCLDAAAAVLKSKGEPMQCRAMVEAMAEKGLWKSSAPTPHATLFSALLREIKSRGNASRFKKAEQGHFTLNPAKND